MVKEKSANVRCSNAHKPQLGLLRSFHPEQLNSDREISSFLSQVVYVVICHISRISIFCVCLFILGSNGGLASMTLVKNIMVAYHSR